MHVFSNALFGTSGHHAFFDNFYGSPQLMSYLADVHGTGSVATVKPNTDGLPLEFTMKELRKTCKSGGKPQFAVSGKMLLASWYDKKKPRTAMSTLHDPETAMFEGRKKKGQRSSVEKPAFIKPYNKCMGATDSSDQMGGYYSYNFRTRKWYLKYFHDLKEKSLVNAYIMYKQVAAARGEKVMSRKMFHISVGEALIGRLPPIEPLDDPTTPMRFNKPGTHWLEQVPQGRRPDCIVCSDRNKKRHQTQLRCKVCKAPLCPFPCHERYHTLQNFKLDREAGREE